MNKHERLERAANEMYHALQVILKTKKNFNHLYMNDQKALHQCGTAVDIYLNRNDRVWMEAAYEGLGPDDLAS